MKTTKGFRVSEFEEIESFSEEEEENTRKGKGKEKFGMQNEKKGYQGFV